MSANTDLLQSLIPSNTLQIPQEPQHSEGESTKNLLAELRTEKEERRVPIMAHVKPALAKKIDILSEKSHLSKSQVIEKLLEKILR